MKVVFNFLKYTEQANTQIRAIHRQSDKDQRYKRHLSITNLISRLPLPTPQIRIIWNHSWYFVIPRNRCQRYTLNNRREVVVETEGERRRPGTDK